VTEDQNPEQTDSYETQEVELQRLRDENAAYRKKITAEREIADEMEAAERDEEDLKARAKKAKERKDSLADSLKALVKGDVQTDLGEFSDGMDQLPISWDNQATAEQKKAAGDVLQLGPDIISWPDVELAALSALASTGKPQKIKPVEIFGLHYVLTDVSDRVATLHQLLGDTAWEIHYSPVAFLDLPNSDRTADLDALGKFAGIPVKVGRKVQFICGDALAMLVRIPDNATVGNAGQTLGDADDLPPRDYGLIANQIRVRVQDGNDKNDPIANTVSALATIMDLPGFIIRAAIDTSEDMGYFNEDADDPVVQLR